MKGLDLTSKRQDVYSYGLVHGVALFEGPVQGHLADLRAHRGLRQLRHREEGVVHAVGGLKKRRLEAAKACDSALQGVIII